MANEYLLKMIVNGLENLAKDNETLCDHMNLRAQFYGFRRKFEGKEFKAPGPTYESRRDLQEQAADLVNKVADNNALAVLYLKGTPASAEALDRKKVAGADEADLLRLMIDWGILLSGAYKAILQLYGRQPASTPPLPSPGAASEDRLWAEIVAWLQKVAADTDLYDSVQQIAAKGTPKEMSAGVAKDSLVRMEHGIRRLTLDIMQIAGLLPHHLYHAAHAGAGVRVKR